MTFRRTSVALVAAVSSVFLLISSDSWAQQSLVSTSADGLSSLSIHDSGAATFMSVDGETSFEVGPLGIQVGTFAFSAVELASEGTERRFVVTVTSPNASVSGILEVGPDGEVLSYDPAVMNALATLASTPEGEFLLPMKDEIPGLSSEVDFLEVYPSFAAVQDNLDGPYNCTMNVLNAVGGAFAMIAGCGTPACGLAYRYCCGSGVAWYASGVMGVASACRVATWR